MARKAKRIGMPRKTRFRPFKLPQRPRSSRYYNMTNDPTVPRYRACNLIQTDCKLLPSFF